MLPQLSLSGIPFRMPPGRKREVVQPDAGEPPKTNNKVVEDAIAARIDEAFLGTLTVDIHLLDPK